MVEESVFLQHININDKNRIQSILENCASKALEGVGFPYTGFMCPANISWFMSLTICPQCQARWLQGCFQLIKGSPSCTPYPTVSGQTIDYKKIFNF